MNNTDWKQWQSQVLQEEYVLPELRAEELSKKIEAVNRKRKEYCIYGFRRQKKAKK
ncbi:hypothetical protein [Bacillus alkalicellulosilyticus]|uniref:hypothetical protein n=1 Tax=Alkalihalobacterium alkalicellulosilyticum TaxID=1912214 RepID=UPI001483A214|nr:hypothetical protein [Bacillus alkalicellulosilyticus]